ncbi:MAG TPA: hypothetical protein VIJ87_01285 [Pyrinomonadaceae bacterium]
MPLYVVMSFGGMLLLVIVVVGILALITFGEHARYDLKVPQNTLYERQHSEESN